MQKSVIGASRAAFALVAICLVLARSPAPADAAKNASAYLDSLPAFESLVRDEMAKYGVPGLTIGFIKDDQMWVKSFGLADVENRVPMTDSASYRLASVQKSMTAVAVLQLVEQGKMKLDAEIQTYVPYFPKKEYPITVRQLLGHLSGIPHYVNRDAEQHIKVHKTTREAIAIFEGFDLVAEPGTKFVYSSYGYNLLGAAIEGVSGEAYGDYMREHVWLLAGMRDTRMDDPTALIRNRVRGYQPSDSGIANSEFIDVSSRFAAGGTRGTVPDLLRFMQALNDGRLLNRHSVELMYTPMRTRDGTVSGMPGTDGYGMGWNVSRQKAGLVVMNDGGQQETRTFILNVPSRHFAMAIAQNLERDTGGALVFRLYQLVVGQPLVLGN
jgi:CubicO group peptidase (beta-lactamase class C family)